MKLLYITNIPTPYRTYRFNALAQVCKQNGVDLEVWYMNQSEPDRQWQLDHSTLAHQHTIFSSNKVKKALGMWMHITPKLHWRLLRADYDIAVLGGLASPAHFIAALLLKRDATAILSVESNIASIGNHSGLATRVKQFLMNRFSMFQITGQKAAEFIRHYVPNVTDSGFVTLPNVINEPLFANATADKVEGSLKKLIDECKQQSRKVVLIPARLIEEKGLFPFLECVRQDDPLDILLAGDGPLLESLKNYVKEHKLPVHFLGSQSPQAIADLMQAVDVLCLPSKSDPSPLSVIEACASGLPILASRNIGNFADVVDEQTNGWGFDFADPVSTRHAIDKLIAITEAQRVQMAARSKAIFRERFHSKFVLQRYVEELLTLASATRRTGALSST